MNNNRYQHRRHHHNRCYEPFLLGFSFFSHISFWCLSVCTGKSTTSRIQCWRLYYIAEEVWTTHEWHHKWWIKVNLWYIRWETSKFKGSHLTGQALQQVSLPSLNSKSTEWYKLKFKQQKKRKIWFMLKHSN